MNWMPKGERPSAAGAYFVEGFTCLDGIVHLKAAASTPAISGRILVLWLALDGTERGCYLDDRRFKEARFARASTPPEWDLVEVLEEFAASPVVALVDRDKDFQPYSAAAAIQAILTTVRAYLAGEPNPSAPAPSSAASGLSGTDPATPPGVRQG